LRHHVIKHLAALRQVDGKRCPQGVRNPNADWRTASRFGGLRVRSASHFCAAMFRAQRTDGRAKEPSGRRRSHRVPIPCVARCEWASRRPVWRKPAPARPPKPTSAAFAKRLQRAVGVEHFDAGASPRVDVVERLMVCALARVGCGGARYHHAALSAGSARANSRRYCAALDAWLQAVKKARLSAFNSSIQGPI